MTSERGLDVYTPETSGESKDGRDNGQTSGTIVRIGSISNHRSDDINIEWPSRRAVIIAAVLLDEVSLIFA